MEAKYLKDPYLLEEIGFKRNEEESTDSVRTIYFENTRETLIYYFHFRIKFTLYISDSPFAKGNDNFQYDFEEIQLAINESDSILDDEKYYRISATDIKNLNKLISLL